MKSTTATFTSTPATAFLHPKKCIGGMGAPITYSFEERVFGPGDTPPEKAAAKLDIVESLRSRILSADKPQWNQSTSNWDDMQMNGKCYKRTNIHAERNRSNMFGYNFRAEKLPKKNPTLKTKSNRFNTGILEVIMKDEYEGEAFGNERVMRGIAKCTEELPNHPDLYDSKPWNQSVELTESDREHHGIAKCTEELPNHPDLYDSKPWNQSVELTQSDREHHVPRQSNSEKWRHKIGSKDNYKSPEQLSKEISERKRKEKQEIIAAISNQRF
ncbi:hypothetical protein PHMEG_00018072 [Phytophthora megakarya]|uniref:Uncharacterized protein n=1 Tax=Phytophthora megakarya TaxID=4795 RepID=A0A225VUY7_9STRA|nr:hypothetical protein PHMEG_00018072 [Phytophthora megakarya]